MTVDVSLEERAPLGPCHLFKFKGISRTLFDSD